MAVAVAVAERAFPLPLKRRGVRRATAPNCQRQRLFLDLLFYHVRLRCYVVIDLKMGEVQPEFAGRMNFYLAAADNLLRHSDNIRLLGARLGWHSFTR